MFMLWGSVSELPAPLHTKEQIPDLVVRWCSYTTVSSSPRITVYLLVSPPHCWECAGKYSNPSWMDHPWMGWVVIYQQHQAPPRTLAVAKIEENSVRWNEERGVVCGQHLQNHSLCGNCLLGSSVHLLSLSLALKQIKLRIRLVFAS